MNGRLALIQRGLRHPRVVRDPSHRGEEIPSATDATPMLLSNAHCGLIIAAKYLKTHF